MNLSQDELNHLATLARINISPEFREQFQKQIGDVLSYVSQLKEVDTKGVDPTFRGGEMGERLRADEVQASDEEVTQAIHKGVPEMSGDYIKAQSALSHKEKI